MAHNLYIENGSAHMMFVGELPWHGLGTQLSKPATSAEAIKAAGLDWRVKKIPLYAIDGPGAARLPKHFGIVPEDRWGKPDCPVFGVVSDGYRPLQNTEAFDFFDSIVGEGAAIYHTAGALGKGEQVWVLAKLPGMMEVTPSDMMEKYVLLSTGHDGKTCVRVTLTPVRVVCQNTLTFALENGDGLARAYHTRDMDRQLAGARQVLRDLMSGFDTAERAFRAMASHTMTEETVKAYLANVFPAPRAKASPSSPSRRSVFNVQRSTSSIPSLQSSAFDVQRSTSALPSPQSSAFDVRRSTFSPSSLQSSAFDVQPSTFDPPSSSSDRKVPAWILEDRANCLHLFHNGIGNNDTAVKETLWAAYNGVTEYVDHWRSRGGRQHMHAVCFGHGFEIKDRAFSEAMKMTGGLGSS